MYRQAVGKNMEKKRREDEARKEKGIGKVEGGKKRQRRAQERKGNRKG
jgi:hypothetical protein